MITALQYYQKHNIGAMMASELHFSGRQVYMIRSGEPSDYYVFAYSTFFSADFDIVKEYCMLVLHEKIGRLEAELLNLSVMEEV